MTLDEMRAVLLNQFDVSSDTADGWCNEAYKQATSEAKWFAETASLGSTVAGQAAYSLPVGVVQLDSLFVNGVEYGRVGEFDITDLNAANAFLSVSQGVYGQSFSTTGQDQITLFPTPDASSTGQAITGKGVFVPATLTTGQSPVFPEYLHPGVLDGALEIGYLREDERPDLAAVHGARFQDLIRKLRALRVSRVRGRGPFRAGIAGRDFSPT